MGLLLAFSFLAGVIWASAAAQAASPGHNGPIAFTSDRDGNQEIYTMAADGSAQTRRTSSAAADFSPSFSPDGKTLAFTSNRDGNEEI